MKQKIIIPVLVITMAGASVFGAGQALAQDDQQTDQPHAFIIQKLATKFGLNETDVEAVFKEARVEKQAQMQAKLEDRLSKIVSEGKVTEAQKQAILAKHQELRDKRQAMMDETEKLTPEQRRERLKTEKEELETWAKDNGIELRYFFGGPGDFRMKLKMGHK
jgi:hypothetical protein